MVAFKWIEFCYDPSVIFIATLIVFAPAYFSPTRHDLIRHLTDEYFLNAILFVVCFASVVILTTKFRSKKNKAHLRSLDITTSLTSRIAARYFLLWGVFLHGLVFGASGLLGKYPTLKPYLDKFDLRYALPYYYPTSAVMHVKLALDVTVLLPLCLSVYFCMNHGYTFASYNIRILYGVVLMTSVTFTALTEIATGLRNVPMDWRFSFTRSDVIHFWLGFVGLFFLQWSIGFVCVLTGIKGLRRLVVVPVVQPPVVGNAPAKNTTTTTTTTPAATPSTGPKLKKN
eukprot:PhF_6_TR34729/c0_g1_i3/m.50536